MKTLAYILIGYALLQSLQKKNAPAHVSPAATEQAYTDYANAFWSLVDSQYVADSPSYSSGFSQDPSASYT